MLVGIKIDEKYLYKDSCIFLYSGDTDHEDIRHQARYRDIDFKDAEGTMFANRGAIYYFRYFESLILINKGYLIVDALEKNDLVKGFIKNLEFFNLIKKVEGKNV